MTSAFLKSAFFATLTISATSAYAVILVDNFVAQHDVELTADPFNGFVTGSSSIGAPTALGGQRDLFVQKTAGDAGDRVRARVNPNGANLFRVSTDSDVNAISSINYDGTNDFTSTGAIDFDGLGGIDVSSETFFRVQIRSSDAPGPIRVTIWDANDVSGNTFATIVESAPILSATGVPTNIDLRLSDFQASGGSLTDIYDSVGAVQFSVDGTSSQFSGWDSSYQSLSFIPEPANFTLLFSASALMLCAIRRRRV